MRHPRTSRLLILVTIYWTFITPVFALEASRFVQLCDTQLGMGGYEADKIRFDLAVKAINVLKADWVVICGDLVNDGNDDKAVADFKAIKGQFKMPVYVAPGNHDVGNAPTAESLERYRKLQGPDYYTVTERGVRMLIVNTQLWKAPVPGESEKQDAWFSSELLSARDSDAPTLIVSHYPPFVTSVEEPEAYFNLGLEKRKALLTEIHAAGIKGWLAGHVHKNIVLNHEGMPIVASATTSKNFDGAPYGFRVWNVSADGQLENEYVAIEIPEGVIAPDAEKPTP